MHPLIEILLVLLGVVITLFATLSLLLQTKMLLVVKANEYLVLGHGKEGKKRYRVLTNQLCLRWPPREAIIGEVPRGERIYEWDIGEILVVRNDLAIAIPAYVVSVKLTFSDDQQVILRSAKNGINPYAHLQRCVIESIVSAGEILDPELAGMALRNRIELDVVAQGYSAVSVRTYTEGI